MCLDVCSDMPEQRELTAVVSHLGHDDMLYLCMKHACKKCVHMCMHAYRYVHAYVNAGPAAFEPGFQFAIIYD